MLIAAPRCSAARARSGPPNSAEQKSTGQNGSIDDIQEQTHKRTICVKLNGQI
jgi:hypothetical protein